MINKKTNKIENDMYEKESLLLDKITRESSDENITKENLRLALSFLIKSYGKLLKLVRKITRVGDANQRKLVLAYDKIDKQKKELDNAYEKLDKLARKDPLTGLSNRRDFLEKVSFEKIRFERDKKEFAIVLSDIDNFKSFNDTYGHDCGDFVLKQVAEVFSNNIRKQDTVGRWGGEEFILLLPVSLSNGAVKIAEKIRKAISEQIYVFGELKLNISMTFGVSIYDGTVDIDKCIKLADEALYKGKQKGKNCVVYEPR